MDAASPEMGSSLEPFRKPTQITLATSEYLKENFGPTIESLNIINEGMSAIKIWVFDYTQKTVKDRFEDGEWRDFSDLLPEVRASKKLSDGIRALRSLEADQIQGVVNSQGILTPDQTVIPEDLRERVDRLTDEQQRIDMLRAYLQQIVIDNSGEITKGKIGFDQSKEAEAITLEQPRDVRFYLKKVSQVNHEIGNPLAPIIMRVALSSRRGEVLEKDIDMIDNQFKVLAKNSENGDSVFLEKYPHKDISVTSTANVLTDAFANYLNREISFNRVIEEDLRGEENTVDWSEFEASGLGENIAINAQKAYEARDPQRAGELMTLDVKFRTRVGEGKAYLEIVFEDQATGFPNKILRKGFFYGGTGWGVSNILGQGIGMDLHQSVLTNEYNGFMILRNIKDGEEEPDIYPEYFEDHKEARKKALDLPVMPDDDEYPEGSIGSRLIVVLPLKKLLRLES